jgi:hypothetical protein
MLVDGLPNLCKILFCRKQTELETPRYHTHTSTYSARNGRKVRINYDLDEASYKAAIRDHRNDGFIKATQMVPKHACLSDSEDSEPDRPDDITSDMNGRGAIFRQKRVSTSCLVRN